MNACLCLELAGALKAQHAVLQGKQRIVAADPDIQTGMVYSATLTLDDVAGFGKLTTENLNTESFCLRQ